MTLTARELALAPNPLQLASRLAGETQLAFLWSASGGGMSYIGVRPLAQSAALDPEPELATTQPRSELERAPRWIGLLPYESRRCLERPAWGVARDAREAPHFTEPIWWRFGAVVCIGERVSVVGDDASSVNELSRQLMTASESNPGEVVLEEMASEPPERHAERVRAALDLITQGQIYQVSLARRLELRVRGATTDLLRRLCRETRPPYAAAFRFDQARVISTSPELLLEHRVGGRLMTSPIKGTRPRGSDAASDALMREDLSRDLKERAELSMIIDVERNDLGKVASIGTVRVQPPVVSTQGLVWHRRANVLAELRPGVSRRELLEAMLPSGSVTGAPKVRAMELIAELESARRGLYTGGLGFITHGGEMTLSMAIRTLTLEHQTGHYFTGGGVVADSSPEREVDETHWKARQLFGRAG